jgi:anti-sigma factor RsiW
MTAHRMTCDRFEALLGDFLEESLDAATREAGEAHRTACPACAALVADLDAIVVAAATLPPPTMERDLWPAIEARLGMPADDTAPRGTRVLDFSAARAARPARASQPITWRRLAIAAAALVTVSAGVTWQVAQRTTAEAPTALVADAASADAAPSDAAPADLSPAVAATRAASRLDRPALPLDTLYGREIALLRQVAETNLGLLDSATVTVVRRNLDIIDQAIRESREALLADPNSGFLLEQLDHAYERKVELLRRLAML